MDITTLIPQIPTWAVLVGSFFLVILSIYLGYRLGSYHRKHSGGEGNEPVGSVVGATLGLLAFMLAFTFGITASRFDARKQLLLDDVNVIETAFLRSDFLVEPYRTEIKKLFRDYVSIRTAFLKKPELLGEVLTESEEIHDKLWALAVAAVAETPNQEITSSFIESLNDVINFHTKRVTVGLMCRIPTSSGML
ncbi:MAG: hypothetical protein ACREOP_01155 [Thermodesulfobacteriota bacterium]